MRPRTSQAQTANPLEVHRTPQTEGEDTVNGSSHVAAEAVEDADVQETIKQTNLQIGMQGNLRRDLVREETARRAVHRAGTDRGAGEEEVTVVITVGRTEADRRLRVARKSMEKGRVPADVGDHPGAFSVGISVAVEEDAGHARRTAKNKVVKRAPVDNPARVSVGAVADLHVLVVKTHSLNLLLQRLKIPQELLSLKKASLCRTQLQKVQLRSSHAVMHYYIISIMLI